MDSEPTTADRMDANDLMIGGGFVLFPKFPFSRGNGPRISMFPEKRVEGQEC